MVDTIVEIAVKCLAIILPAVCTWVAWKIKKVVTTRVQTQEAQDVVKTVVCAVEQMYKDLHGEEKLRKAINLSAEFLLDHGINVTAEEIRVLIESSVAEFNDVFKVKETVDETVKLENE